ncbi:NAD-dependent epimerase/dehydratase family protein [Amycolatopsis sp. NPDC049868]|uniref:NAD-dependent epimerase/dehydratase family protein n=1 Tax=Amycolatopsis sp. NPDC049868 TaxID=3363934 RepID=UPI0037A9CD01
MAILVTGATGRVGSRFVPRLLSRQDERVRVFVRDPGKAAGLGAEVFVGDLREAESRERALDGMDAVVHLGAVFRGDSDAEVAAVNNQATVELAEAAAKAGVERFVHVSTTLVYGAGRGRPARETDEPAPSRDFGAYPPSKAEAEKLLLDLHRTAGLPLRIARLAYVYGEGDPHLAESPRFVRDWPPHKRFHLVHHADVGEALLGLLRADGLDGRTYNVADDAPLTALELFALNGEPMPEGAESRTLDDPWEGIVDTARLRRDLGFRPLYPTVYSAKDGGAL